MIASLILLGSEHLDSILSNTVDTGSFKTRVGRGILLGDGAVLVDGVALLGVAGEFTPGPAQFGRVG